MTEAENIIEHFRQEKIKKLTEVGFTEEQAVVLVELMSQSSLGFGFF